MSREATDSIKILASKTCAPHAKNLKEKDPVKDTVMEPTIINLVESDLDDSDNEDNL